MASRGRQLLFVAEPEIRERLINAIQAGNYYLAACAYAGITYQTFRNWMITGAKASSGAQFDLFEDVRRAEGEAEVRMVAQWQSQMPTDWRATRDFLARRFPDRWGPKIEIAGDQERPIQHEVIHRVDYGDYEREFQAVVDGGDPKRLPPPSGNGTGQSVDTADPES